MVLILELVTRDFILIKFQGNNFKENAQFLFLCNLQKSGIPEFLDPGRKSWTLDPGLWTLDYGRWTLDPGLWTLSDFSKSGRE